MPCWPEGSRWQRDVALKSTGLAVRVLLAQWSLQDTNSPEWFPGRLTPLTSIRLAQWDLGPADLTQLSHNQINREMPRGAGGRPPGGGDVDAQGGGVGGS